MVLERFAVITLQLRAKLLGFYQYLLRETESQLGLIFFTCCLFFLTGLLWYVWVMEYPLWFKIGFTPIYLVSALFCISAMYFIFKQKRIRNSSNTMEVYTLVDPGSEKFQHLKLTSIALTQVQASGIFNEFSEKYLHGKYQSFQSLLLLKPVPCRNRLVWKDLSPKRPKQVNRQTLLEFLSHLLNGFENLDNHQMIQLADHYFILKNSAGTTQTLSTKNVSNWRTNKAPYLLEISRLIKKHL
jgi:glucan phosphoethanolaminetransferase (alkaline phosphatase superfamily)